MCAYLRGSINLQRSLSGEGFDVLARDVVVTNWCSNITCDEKELT